jgi:hypothetical protein
MQVKDHLRVLILETKDLIDPDTPIEDIKKHYQHAFGKVPTREFESAAVVIYKDMVLKNRWRI